MLPDRAHDLVEGGPHVRVHRFGVLVERLDHLLAELFVPVDDVVKIENHPLGLDVPREVGHAEISLVLLGEALAFGAVFGLDVVWKFVRDWGKTLGRNLHNWLVHLPWPLMGKMRSWPFMV